MLKRTIAFAVTLLLVSASGLVAQDATPHSGYLTPNLDILVQTFDEFADSNLFLFSLGIGFH